MDNDLEEQKRSGNVDTRATNRPIVVDLGKQTNKRIKQLKRGSGRLIDRIDGAMTQAASRVPQGKEIVPVVVVFRKKDRRRGGGLPIPF